MCVNNFRLIWFIGITFSIHHFLAMVYQFHNYIFFFLTNLFIVEPLCIIIDFPQNFKHRCLDVVYIVFLILFSVTVVFGDILYMTFENEQCDSMSVDLCNIT